MNYGLAELSEMLGDARPQLGGLVLPPWYLKRVGGGVGSSASSLVSRHALRMGIAQLECGTVKTQGFVLCRIHHCPGL